MLRICTVRTFVLISSITLACCFFKQGYHPDRYFTDVENGAFNTFDFVIVVSGFALASIGGGAIAALRMLRLVRLLTFIKGVQQLRVIVSGLVTGLKSVSYIVSEARVLKGKKVVG